MARKITYEEFLRRASEVYGDKFTYVQSSYECISKPMEIECEAHGIFRRTPNHFLLGAGCPTCWDEAGRPRAGRVPHLSHSDFKEQAEEVATIGTSFPFWPGTKSQKEKVPVRCPNHGEAERVISYVLAGKDCMACEYAKRHVSFSEFLRRAKLSQGDEYSYDEASYMGMKRPVTVICSKHGSFSAPAGGHATGRHRCPECSPSDSSGERLVASLLKELQFEYTRQYTHETLVGLGGIRIRIDFAIPSKKILIEFDGPQHFGPIRFGSKSQEEAEEDFVRVQAHDMIKEEWARANGWDLKRFRQSGTLEEEIRQFLTSLH